MELTTAHNIANELMDEHGLWGWTFTFDNAKSRFGVCRFGTQTISLSRPLTEINDEEQVRDTILHEIAHALAGHEAGHGPRWRRVAASIGARPERCVDAATINTPKSAWTGSCPACDFTVGRHRLTDAAKRGACPKCCDRYNGGRFTETYRLQWRRTA
jgi:predicted SprT family Zn-dependent metalloprotease